MTRSSRRSYVALIAGGIFVALIVAWSIANYWGSGRDVTFNVTDKQRVCSSSGNGVSCKYLIYTSAGTFEDSDSLVSGKFNSSDMFGRISVGHQYTAHVRGWRSGLFSMYPNILSIHEA